MSNTAEVIQKLAPQLIEGSKSGPNRIMILCPFHNERTPSCSVAIDKPVFYCHGCQESGHVSRLLSAVGVARGLVKALMPEGGGPSRVQNRPRTRLQASLERNPFKTPFVLDEDLLDPYRTAPKALLRDYDKKVLHHFEVGLDRIQLRATFPLRDYYGNLAGVSGRALADQEPRYLVYKKDHFQQNSLVPADYSMESVKESILWHLHMVHPFLVHDDEPLIIVEGFKACMSVYQHATPRVVALAGSRFTNSHTKLLPSLTQNVILFLDNDEAGHKGTLHAGKKLIKRGVRVLVAIYSDRSIKQPTDLEPNEIVATLERTVSYRKWRSHYAEIPESHLRS